VYEKYKAMRDTAIDIGKWISTGYTKKEDKASVTKYNTPFMEQRLARISNNNNGGRNQTHAKGSPTLYAKTSPPEVTHSDQIFMSANSQLNAIQRDDLEMTGLPNLKNVKKSDHKAMIQRLTMYNYNMQNNSAVQKKNPLITHVLGGTSTGSGGSNLQS